MRSAVPGCLLHVVALAAVAWLLDTYVLDSVAGEVRRWFALASSVFLTLGVSSFAYLAAGYGRGDRARGAVMRRAEEGSLPAEDGPAVVSGRVRPAGQALVSPLTQTPCVSYWYRMFYEIRITRGRPKEVPVFWGYASCPFLVDTKARAARVLAVPNIVHATRRVRGDEVVTRARAHRDTASFEVVSGMLGALGTAFTGVDDVFGDDDGEVRRDWRAAGETKDPAELILEEAVLPVGATASVSGTWSTRRGAIVPALAGEGGPSVTVTLGGLESLDAVTGAVPHSTLSYLVTATILTALGAAIAWAALRFFAAA